MQTLLVNLFTLVGTTISFHTLMSSISYVGKVNGIDITKNLMLDDSNCSKNVIHFMLPKPVVMRIADRLIKMVSPVVNWCSLVLNQQEVFPHQQWQAHICSKDSFAMLRVSTEELSRNYFAYNDVSTCRDVQASCCFIMLKVNNVIGMCYSLTEAIACMW